MALVRNLRHGHAFGHRSPTYNSWRAMIDRCTTSRNPKHKTYKSVNVCERWLGSFSNFLSDMGERPTGMTIDRIDNSDGYHPGNCRWATRAQQSSNTTRNRRYSYLGVSLTATEWERRLGLRPGTIRQRITRGWSFERAISDGEWK